MVREKLLHLPSESLIKPEPFGPHGILCEKKSSVAEEPRQSLPFLWCERIELIFSSHIKEGAEEEIWVREGCHPPFLHPIDTGSQLQFLDDGFSKLRIRIPFAAAVFELGKEKMGKGSTEKGFRGREKKPGCQPQP